MSKAKRFRAFLLTFPLILLVNFSCSSRKRENSRYPSKIRIGTIRVANDKTVMRSLKIFEEALEEKGIKSEYIFFDSGTSANVALSSGGVDFAEMGYTNALIALARGIEVKCIWIHEILGANEALVAQKNRGITTVSDLKGKVIATPFVSTSHYSLMKALDIYGVKKSEVTLLDMDSVDIVSAFEQQNIDAAYSWEPTLTKLKEKGHTLLTSEDMAALGFMTANVELVRTKFAKKYPTLVTLYISSLAKAGEVYENNPEIAVKAAAKALNITYEQASSQMKGTKWLSLKEEISADYLGDGTKAGKFAFVFYDTAQFLQSERKLKNIPSLNEIGEFIESKYIKSALEMEGMGKR